MPGWPHSPPHRTIVFLKLGTPAPLLAPGAAKLAAIPPPARINPVHHGIVPVAENYTWCSAGWFNMHGDPAFRRTVESFKTDSLKWLMIFEDGAGNTKRYRGAAVQRCYASKRLK